MIPRFRRILPPPPAIMGVDPRVRRSSSPSVQSRTIRAGSVPGAFYAVNAIECARASSAEGRRVVHGGWFTRGRQCRTLPERESVCMAGLCVRAILINTLLTPRPGNINHKTMENGARGRSQQRDLSIPLSCTRRVRSGALHIHTRTRTHTHIPSSNPRR